MLMMIAMIMKLKLGEQVDMVDILIHLSVHENKKSLLVRRAYIPSIVEIDLSLEKVCKHCGRSPA